MKKLLIIFFMLLFSFTGITQNCKKCPSENNVKFDYYKQEFIDSQKPTVIKNKGFTFKLLNVNTFKYKFIIDGETVNFNTENSGAFEDYLKNEKASYGTDNLSNDCEIVVKYKKLESIKLFYTDLTRLLNSDLIPFKIVEAKKELFYKYLGFASNSDVLDASIINNYYTKLISDLEGVNYNFNNCKDSIIISKNIEQIVALNLPTKLSNLYEQINNETFTINKYINKPDADLLKVKIIKQELNGKNKGNALDSLTLNILIKQGIKIDFSAGIFFTNVSDDEYLNAPMYKNQTDTIIGYRLIPGENNPLSYGVASFMHVYWRNSMDFNVAFSLGLGIDQDTNLKIMPGIGIILGRKKRFVINGGLAIGKAKELSPVHDIDKVYKEQITVSYTETYNTGWFIAATYNF